MDLSEKLEKYIKLLKNILISIFVGLGITVMLAAVFVDDKNITVIRPFEVPKNLEEAGLNGRSIATILYGKTKKIYAFARTRHQSSVEAYIDDTTIEVEFEGVTLKNIIRHIKKTLGKTDNKIEGVIFEDSGNLTAIIIINGVESIRRSGNLKNVNMFLEALSEDVIKYTEPYVLARYFSNKEKQNNDKILNLIYRCLSNKNSTDDYWAINLWGNMYFEEDKYDKAAKKYYESYELAKSNGVDFAIALSNYGAALAFGGEYEKAEKYLNDSIDLDDSYYHPYYINGVIYYRNNDYDTALDYLNMALKRNPSYPGTYYHLSRLYWLDKNNAEKAIRFAKISIHLFDKQGNKVLSDRSKAWIKQVCNEMIEETTEYKECNA